MRVALPALPVLALALAACASPRGGPTTNVAAADALDRKFVEAFNKGDADAVAALYWHDPGVVSFRLDGTVDKGWDAVKAACAASLKSMPGATLALAESHNTAFGDTVAGWGRWKLTVPAAGGAPQVLEGGYTDVKIFRDGRWAIAVDHASVPMPPKPAPMK